MSILQESTTKAFFSAGVLQQLAIQRHEHFDGAVGQDGLEAEKRQRREAIAAVANLLHGGTGYFNAAHAAPDADYDPGHFYLEFVRFLASSRRI